MAAALLAVQPEGPLSGIDRRFFRATSFLKNRTAPHRLFQTPRISSNAEFQRPHPRHAGTGRPAGVRAFADGSGVEERLTASEFPQIPWSWSPDGQLLA